MTDLSTCRSSLYPSFEPRYEAVPDAPPMESERWPLTASAPMYAPQATSYNAYYVPPSYGQAPPPPHHHLNHHRKPGFVITTLKLTLFHLLNALLSVAAFTAVVTSIHVAFGLIPLCCVGLLVFRFVVVLVRWLAQQDVKLCSYFASPDEERVALDARDEELGRLDSLRIASELSSFSPVSVLATLYFATIKLAIGILSLTVVALFATLPMLLVAFNSDDGDVHMRIKMGHHRVRYEDLQRNPLTFYVVWGCLFIFTIVGMHVVAWVSRAATLFFCTERISESEHIPVMQYPAPPAVTTYGSSLPTRTYQ